MKINVVSLDENFPQLHTLHYSERQKIISDIANEAENYGIDKSTILAFIDLYDDVTNNYVPKDGDIIDIILQFISKFTSIKFVIDVDLTKGTVAWKFWLPTTPVGNVTRLLITNRTVVFIKNLQDTFYFGTGTYIDIHKIMYKNIQYDLKQLSGILHAVTLFRTKIYDPVNYHERSIKQPVQVEFYKYRTDLEKQLLYNLHDIFNTPTHFTNKQSILAYLINFGILNVYLECKNNIDNIKHKHIISENIKRTLNERTLYDINKYYWNNVAETLYPNKKEYTKDELNNINASYELNMNFITKVLSNNCGHLKVLRKLRETIKLSDKLTLLKILTKYMIDVSEHDAFIRCNICGLPIICPHIKKYMELKFTGCSDIQITDNLISFANTQINDSSCKICGDSIVLATANLFDEYSGSGEFALLRRYIIIELRLLYEDMKITPDMSQFEFESLIQNQIFLLFINSPEPTLVHLLHDYDSTDIVGPELRIHIIMYVYAYLLNMIKAYFSASDKESYIKFGFKTGLSNNIKNYGETIINIFRTNHDNYYRNYSHIDHVKILEYAYMYISNNSKKLLFKFNANKRQIIYNMFINQSIYRYASKICNIFNTTPCTFEIISGVTEKNLDTYSYTYHIKIDQTLYIPQYNNQKRYETFDPGYVLDWKYVNYISILDNKILYTNTSETLDMLHRLMMYTPNYIIRPYKTIPDIIPKLTIKYVYDTNGKYHIFDKYIYTERLITDYECSVCGIRKSNIHTLDDAVISELLVIKNKYSTIVEYLYVLCPVNELHVFKDDVCIHCAFDIKYTSNINQDTKAYVDKYIGFYKESTSATINTGKCNIIEQKINNISWDGNTEYIAQASTILDIDIYDILNLGLRENLTAETIMLTPDLPLHINDIHIDKVYEYFLLLVVYLNIFKYADDVMNTQFGSIILAAFNSADSTNVDDIAELHTYIRSMDETIIQDIYEFKHNRDNDPNQIRLYIINSMCKYFLQLIIKSNIGRGMIKYFINTFVHSDKYLYIPGKFDKSLFMRPKYKKEEEHDITIDIEANPPDDTNQ